MRLALCDSVCLFIKVTFSVLSKVASDMKVLRITWLAITTILVSRQSIGDEAVVRIEDARVRGIWSILNGTVEVRCGPLWYDACLFYYLANSERRYICQQHYQQLYMHATDGFHTNWSAVVADGSAIEVQYIRDRKTCTVKSSCSTPIFIACGALEASAPEISVNDTVQSLSPYRENTVVSILCTVRGGIPAPNVKIIARKDANITSESQWLSKGTIATNPDYPEVVFYYQIKVNLSYEDNGAVYKCQVDQENFESRNDTITLSVQYAPVINVPVNKTVNVRGNIDIECIVRSNPTVADVGWYDTNGLQKSSTPLLSIENADVSDMQNYTCKASNSFGGRQHTSSASTELYVNYVRVPISVFVREYDDVTITCVLVSYNEVVETIWTKPRVANLVLSNSTLLHLHNVSRNDAGKYKCKMRNRIGTSVQSTGEIAMLYVTYPPIVSVQENITVNTMDDVILNCTVESFPESMVTWYSSDGDELSNITTLELKDVDRSFIGDYTCSAQNIIEGLPYTNSDQTSLFVNFEPIVNVSQITTGVQLHDIEINCGVESYPASSVTWHNQNKEELSNSSILILKRVRLVDAGQYTCMARNYFLGGFHTNSEATIVRVLPNGNCLVPNRPRVKHHCRCNRRCNFKKNIKNITKEEVMVAIEQTKKELTVEPKTLTSFKIKKVSMQDTRTSSIGFGVIAIITMVTVLGFLSAADIIGVVRYLQSGKNRSQRRV